MPQVEALDQREQIVIQLQFLVGDKEHDPTVFADCPCEVSISGLEISKYNLLYSMN